MCRIPDIYSGIRHYPALFKVFGRILRYPAGYRIFQSSGKLRRVDSVKIKLTFSIYVKTFGASLKTLILFGLCTKSRNRVQTLDAFFLSSRFKFSLQVFFWRGKFCHQVSHFNGVAVRQ